MAKILIIDDDSHILTILEVTFLAAGHEVLAAESIKRARAQLGDPDIEAVVLDVQLPDGTGWDLVQSIRGDARTEHLPVIMLSALTEVNNRVRGLRTGADDYMSKPFHPEEMLARVEALIARRPGSQSASGHGQAGLGQFGRLDVQSVEDLVRDLERGVKSGVLEVTAGKNVHGKLVVRHGRLVSAFFRDLEGTEAVLAMTELEKGFFHFYPSKYEGESPPESDGFQALLIDAAWIKDELSSRKLPGPNAPLRLVSAADLGAEFSKIPVELVIRRLDNAPGITLDKLIDEGGAAPNKLRLAVALLFERGALVSV